MGISAEKAKGRYYTPDYIVKNILDLAGYSGKAILGKNVIDNSCGDGAFLAEIVRRYCIAAKKEGCSAQKISKDLGTYIHGIEIDSAEHRKAVFRVNAVAAQFGAAEVQWDILNCDALTVNCYDEKMDFVLGNPPYVRVHHLAETYQRIKKYRYAQGGMTDLFLVFYEIGIRMLKKGGKLGYITPSSLYSSKAASELRADLVQGDLIDSVVNLKHFQPFDAAAFTTIMILQKRDLPLKTHRVKYYLYDSDYRKPIFCCSLAKNDYCINDLFFFGTREALARFRQIAFLKEKSPLLNVKNGFATLCDSFFIGGWNFDSYVIPVVKASTGRLTRCIFPYDSNGKIIPFEDLTASSDIREHYRLFLNKLKKRSLKEGDCWYGFGRSQGIKDVYKNKYAVCPIIKSLTDLKIQFCGKGVGVYGGLYILTEIEQEIIEDILMKPEFLEYTEMLAKYKSGGYYTFSSKDLEMYISYKLAERNREGQR